MPASLADTLPVLATFSTLGAVIFFSIPVITSVGWQATLGSRKIERLTKFHIRLLAVSSERNVLISFMTLAILSFVSSAFCLAYMVISLLVPPELVMTPYNQWLYLLITDGLLGAALLLELGITLASVIVLLHILQTTRHLTPDEVKDVEKIDRYASRRRSGARRTAQRGAT